MSRESYKCWIGSQEGIQTWNFFLIAKPFSSDSVWYARTRQACLLLKPRRVSTIQDPSLAMMIVMHSLEYLHSFVVELWHLQLWSWPLPWARNKSFKGGDVLYIAASSRAASYIFSYFWSYTLGRNIKQISLIVWSIFSSYHLLLKNVEKTALWE